MRNYCLSFLLIGYFLFPLALAQGPGPLPEIQFKWWAETKIVDQVGISTDQVHKIEALWKKSRKPLTELQADIEKHHRELHALFDSQSVDEALFGEKIDHLYRLRADLEKKILHFRLSVRNVLDSDQRKKLRETMASFRKKRPEPPEKQQHKDPNQPPPNP